MRNSGHCVRTSIRSSINYLVTTLTRKLRTFLKTTKWDPKSLCLPKLTDAVIRTVDSMDKSRELPTTETTRTIIFRPALGDKLQEEISSSKQAEEAVVSVEQRDTNVSNFQNTSKNFSAGKMVHFIENWKLITSDQKFLGFVTGYSIEFDSNPFQTFISMPIRFNESETETTDNEISDFFKKGIIEHATSDNDDDYISNIFLRLKKNGKFRVILNLKHLNNFIEYHHFKMETFMAA